MTTVAFRDGKIAADTAMVADGMRCGSAVKIARNQNGDLAGACGHAAYCVAFLDWFRAGEVGDPPPVDARDEVENYGVIYRVSGSVEGFTAAGRSRFRCAYHASGSGGELALGAMAHGATAEEAVRAAMAHDGGTFGDVMVLSAQGASGGEGEKL